MEWAEYKNRKISKCGKEEWGVGKSIILREYGKRGELEEWEEESGRLKKKILCIEEKSEGKL